MDFAGGGIGLTGEGAFLGFRDHGQRSGIGQSFDGFMGLRELFVGNGVFQGKERIHHFLFRGMPLIQHPPQIFHRAGVWPVGILQLLAAHSLMYLP